MSFSGRVYAITGGASGIGLATAKLLASRDATICIADLNVASLSSASQFFASTNAAFSARQVDVSNRREVDSWIVSIIDQFGRLDGAANIAGVIGENHSTGTIADLEDDEWDRIIGVNLTGCMYCLRAELRVIADGGSIVNMASIHGTNAMAKHAAYGASKHGVVGLTKAAAKENGHREVRVNAVAPGAIYTPMMEKAWEQIGRPKNAPFSEPTAFQRQGKPEEIATVVVFLLSPESSFVSGSVYSADGAWL
ncbi:Short-chain dehydrogenase/reductase aba4 [Conoideocrella luteorostrata]|uniref:Short-chain dehydrogenase/reductase aba4 n=1 Tax=Conoideocrella luteorostrata TaxID=1105319 RepID=A0AAJ0CI26_9HYPO|nr:Short-chain dehydrogenase/reductase aba4 [Conoideocrella luteorostrata]